MRRAILFLVCFVSATAAQESPKAVLVDEFSNMFCSDPLRSRLDNFYATISERPGSVGYVVANADASMAGRFLKYFRTFQNHAVFRGFPGERIRYSRGPNSDSLHVQFWLVPQGAQPPNIPPDFRTEPIDTAVMFDASEISSVNKGRVEFGGDMGGEPCDFGLDLNQFAISLGAHTNLDGYLVASSRGLRDRAKTRSALNLTAAELTGKHRIPSHRIKTLYVGNRQSPVMQLWLVPKGSPPPSFRENSVP